MSEPEVCMSSVDSPMRSWEVYLLTAISLGLLIWYATPQLFFVAYPIYEYAKLIAPGLMSGLLQTP